jgi:hypothetical protein
MAHDFLAFARGDQAAHGQETEQRQCGNGRDPVTLVPAGHVLHPQTPELLCFLSAR